MNSITKKAIKWILAFFAFALFVIIVVYLFTKYVPRENQFNVDLLMQDKEIEEIYKKKQKEREEYERQWENREKEVIENLDCIKNGKKYKHGDWGFFYSKRFVSLQDDCGNYQSKKRCDNGQWLGDSFYNEPLCEQSVDCMLENGEILKNGESRDFYFFETVQYGEKCEDYMIKRTCNNTHLKGDSRYKFTECKVTEEGICKFGENIIPNKKTHLFYSVQEVEYTDKCQNYSQLRLCSDGKLFGDEKYKYWDCRVKIPKKCKTEDGKEVEHNQIIKMYSSPYGGEKGCAYFMKQAQCINGKFNQGPEYKYAKCVE
ncbi:hypothetical protein CSB11_01115 [Candidatus Campbellbacteria bacterium]|nr:MAG: hypothetical protein CSB11_01115 [Candidatus Campbellbacteria bacterium]